ncbi:phosphoribosylglycinamide formyltransferase [Serpentinicella sp. ANB-PHB4]|uniref:phosphoribosylglycinamide formyltransferase n=1 Tax=Serpentinicella sp. ANB-PHB4 TaxID=3074076 RepID=UPI002857C325|nr:phosphoribosylglycinamide formyltransferase [Serpentinicella sp. ANB-PHB4]MDR5658595.1 phosphoribosylglycinamide formyltransferase [Serpentinicella sp. ANB-PHB4]
MSGVNIAVLISGSGSNLQSLMDYLRIEKVNGEVKLVVSNKEDAYGLVRAKGHEIKTAIINKALFPDAKDRTQQLINVLENEKIDLIVLAGYLAMVPDQVIEKYRNKIINIHPSLIPSFSGMGYYGLNVHKGAIERGVKITGATVHFVNEETDGGPIILQETVAVDFDDTPETLQKKVLEIEHRLLPYVVKLFIQDKIRVIGNKVKVETNEDIR